MTEDERLDGITDLMDVYLSKLWELDREDGQGSQSMRLQRVEYD